MWCRESSAVASLLCKRVVESNSDPLEAVSLAVDRLSVFTATCVEDVGRQVLSLSEGERCVEALAKAVKAVEDPGLLSSLGERAALLLFAVLFTYYRRLRMEDKMEEVLRRFERILSGSPLYLHAKAMWIEKSDVAPFGERLLLALKYELEALKRDPDYVGAQHKLADLVVQALEEGWRPGPCREPDEGCVPEELVARAKNYLRRLAFELGYARAYYTLARFHIIEGDYDRAVELLSSAIRLEPAEARDYSLRLAEYYNTMFLARNIKRIEEAMERLARAHKRALRASMDEFSEHLRRYEARILTLISVYVGLITIIFTFVTLAESPRLSFTEALILEALIIAAVLFILLLVMRSLNTKR